MITITKQIIILIVLILVLAFAGFRAYKYWQKTHPKPQMIPGGYGGMAPPGMMYGGPPQQQGQ